MKLQALTLFIAGFSLANEPKAVRIGVKTSWPPYHTDTINGASGISVQALDCIMKKINQKYKLIQLPWMRAQKNTKDGIIDGFFSASQNAERDKYAVKTDNFLPQDRNFYLYKKNLKSKIEKINLDYIKSNLKVAARIGSNALYSVENSGYKVMYKTEDTYQLIQGIVAKRADAMLENSLVFEKVADNLNFKLSDFHIVAQEKKDMGVYFGKKYLEKHPGFIERFNKAVPGCSLI